MADVPEGRVAVTVPVTDKLGIAHDVAQGSTLAAYTVTSEGTKLISASMTVLAVPTTGALGTTGQITVAVLPDEVPAVLSASASNDLRFVMPGDGVAQDEDQLRADAAPEQIEPADEKSDSGAKGEAS
jgi:pilus assembly protein CpaB